MCQERKGGWHGWAPNMGHSNRYRQASRIDGLGSWRLLKFALLVTTQSAGGLVSYLKFRYFSAYRVELAEKVQKGSQSHSLFSVDGFIWLSCSFYFYSMVFCHFLWLILSINHYFYSLLMVFLGEDEMTTFQLAVWLLYNAIYSLV